MAAELESEVCVIPVGSTGAGKTTLIKNLFDIKEDYHQNTVIKRGITFRIVTLGETGQQQRQQIELTTDIVVYCVSVNPSDKFNHGNPATMQWLQDTYGKDIWKRCVIAFTFSNIAWDWNYRRYNTDRYSNFVDVARYKQYIVHYATKFQEELKRLNVQDISVKVAFGFSPSSKDQTTIVGVPVGEELDDPVLPDNTYTSKSEWNWKEALTMEIIRKKDDTKLLLQYRSVPPGKHVCLFEKFLGCAHVRNICLASHSTIETKILWLVGQPLYSVAV